MKRAIMAVVLATLGGCSNPGAVAETAEAAEFRAWAGGDTFVMIFPAGLQREEVRRQAKAHCENRQFCKVLGWTDAADAASGYPMTDREVDTLALSYTLNRQSGLDEALWDCRRFTGLAPTECLADP